MTGPSARPVPGPRPAFAGPGAGAGRVTRTVVYDSAHLRVRVRGGEVLWFVRDLGAALGFAPLPATGDGLAQVLVPTAELWPLMAAVGYEPDAQFTAWAEELARSLTRPQATAAALRAIADAPPRTPTPS